MDTHGLTFRDTSTEELLILLQEQKPEKSDVIVWIQGDRLDRGPKVLELFKQGLAPCVLVIGNNTLVGVGPRPGENDIHLDEIRRWLLAGGVPEESIIVHDQALNTREQAKQCIQLAEERGWKRLILVTSPYHLIRLFLTFLRACKEQNSSVALIVQSADIPWDAVPSGRSKIQREVFADELEKIKKYSDHVASVEEGIRYLKNSL